MATWGMQGCYDLMARGEWQRMWADEAKAGVMAWTGVREGDVALGGCRYGGAP